MLNKAKLYFNTIKWLRWEQIVYRLYYRVAKPKVSSLEKYRETNTHNWEWNGPAFLEPSLLTSNEVIFLNEKGPITTKSDWNNPEKEKLWLYNLHYFDDLNAKNSSERRNTHKELMQRWIEENPPVEGNGWEPYPLSLRIVNWVKWLSKGQAKNTLFHASLLQQTEGLLQQLEYNVLGNHLFANAKALIFVGLYSKHPVAEEALRKGVEILEKELNEQFLSDGGHFELSPMYHCIMLNDVLEILTLYSLTNAPQLAKLKATLLKKTKKGINWLDVMAHPDGDISFFNDASFDIAPTPNFIKSLANGLNIRLDKATEKNTVTSLEKSGYTKLENEYFTCIFDHADIGASYLPGHGHADTLSIEFSIKGKRLFVNRGTSQYGIGKKREELRATQSHNTVCIANKNSSEVWGGFRVARRAKAKLTRLKDNEVYATHNGYEKIYRLGQHSRSIKITDRSLAIADYVDLPEKAVAHYLLHPNFKVKSTHNAGKTLILCEARSEITAKFECNSPILIKEAEWNPRFGQSIATTALEIPFEHNSIELQIEAV